ncbi:MAG: Clp protease N-terminal domain-containing protein, partial [Halothiobacillaceae bacterium]
MLSKPLEETLSQAFRLARERRYEYVTLEVLLRMLIEDAEARPVLLGCGVNLEQL